MALRFARLSSARMLLLPMTLTVTCLPALAFAADASIAQVYATARGGDVPGALTMMDQVLKDHPGSAKAHYVEAELLSRSHRAADARVELAKAQQLDPTGHFANARSQAELRAALGAGGAVGGAGVAGVAAPAPYDAGQGGHISFGMILFGALVVFAILAMLRRRSANQYYPPAAQGGYGPGYGPQGGPQGGMMPMGGYGAGYGPGMGGGMGGGLMGGLATGVGMGAGLAVGEEVVGHMFGDHEHRGDGGFGGGMGGGWDQGGGDPNADMGGSDFGTGGGVWDDGGSGGGDGGW